jgi:hypothetical protein
MAEPTEVNRSDSDDPPPGAVERMADIAAKAIAVVVPIVAVVLAVDLARAQRWLDLALFAAFALLVGGLFLITHWTRAQLQRPDRVDEAVLRHLERTADDDPDEG